MGGEPIWYFNSLLIDGQLGGDIVRISMPYGARALSAGVQGLDFFVWAAVDTDAPFVEHRFAVHGTGHPVEDDTAFAPFVNTVFMGPLMFHVFDLGQVAQERSA